MLVANSPKKVLSTRETEKMWIIDDPFPQVGPLHEAISEWSRLLLTDHSHETRMALSSLRSLRKSEPPQGNANEFEEGTG